MTPLEAALSYRCSGISVIPCDASSKKPLVEWRAYQAEIASEETVRSWWVRWPEARVGIVTGAVSGLVVADVDSAEAAAVGEAVRHYGETPRIARTPSGGAHLYYRHPGKPVPNAARLPGFSYPIDVRGDGGYVLAPPSAGYTWEQQARREALPLYRPPVRRQPPSPPSATSGREICAGRRNATLTSLAGSMRRRGMTPTEIAQALCAVNRERCRPPLSEAEVREIAESIGRYAPADDSIRREQDRRFEAAVLAGLLR
jgi:hypothetical protein